MAAHRIAMNKQCYKNNKLYKYMQKLDMHNFIILIKYYPCDNKEQFLSCEQFYFDKYNNNNNNILLKHIAHVSVVLKNNNTILNVLKYCILTIKNIKKEKVEYGTQT